MQEEEYTYVIKRDPSDGAIYIKAYDTDLVQVRKELAEMLTKAMKEYATKQFVQSNVNLAEIARKFHCNYQNVQSILRKRGYKSIREVKMIIEQHTVAKDGKKAD